MKRAALLLFLAGAMPAHADIVVGVAGPMTGQNAAFGQYMKSGVDAAAAAINAKGGINGEPIVVQAVDDQCDVRRAQDAANQLAAADAQLVVGHYCSNAAHAASKIYAERGVLAITPSASAPKVTDEGAVATLRLAMRDDTQGAFAAGRILADDPTATVAVIDDGTPSSKALIAQFAKVKPTTTQIAFKPGERNLAATAEKIAASNATAIYFACGGIEAGSILAAYRGRGGLAKAYGSDALLADAFWERAGSAGEGTLVTFAPDPQSSPDAREAIAAMTATNQPPEGPALAAYAAVQVFALAKAANPTADAKGLRTWLTSGLDFATVLGPIAFDARGDLAQQRFDWYRWSNGTYTRVSEGN